MEDNEPGIKSILDHFQEILEDVTSVRYLRKGGDDRSLTAKSREGALVDRDNLPLYVLGTLLVAGKVDVEDLEAALRLFCGLAGTPLTGSHVSHAWKGIEVAGIEVAEACAQLAVVEMDRYPAKNCPCLACALRKDLVMCGAQLRDPTNPRVLPLNFTFEGRYPKYALSYEIIRWCGRNHPEVVDVEEFRELLRKLHDSLYNPELRPKIQLEDEDHKMFLDLRKEAKGWFTAAQGELVWQPDTEEPTAEK
jgi:hypothetical protein